ncbi:hypothetical protein PV08_06347 [Exophiala spinifera]|uniref:Zn(2)-C6 fungal-type domain-containing protein n=1 Tax=Exophiala spinifera TaxID=91928 RepID=A0A0D1YMM4_9EURO|nr:uncharacterized protein PV08_06347 [Exophiala spinifera]KIW16296.1 hypothetical protein PV08_06347 [Exophiala spinifera]
MTSASSKLIGLKPERRRAFSCETCRKRKVKCDGATPICSRCSRRGDDCQYGLNPTLSYTRALEQKVAHLEAKIRTLECLSADVVSPSGQSTAGSAQTDCNSKPSDGTEGTKIAKFDALRVDDGQLTFHGTTSFFRLPGSLHDDADGIGPSIPSQRDTGRGKDKLINSAWKERAFEQFSNTPEPMKSLLRDHWTWVSPLFNFVYRPAFTRDIKNNGPYYSAGLLSTIFAHSVRWARADPDLSVLLEPYDGGAQFYRQAIAAVFDSVRQGPGKIPEVQALLLLSAQAIGKGHKTQAWLYMGMAMRLMEDMGLNIDSSSYAATAGLSDEDIEIRTRLFWSCYCWEKLLCLYLGRQPVILATHASSPQLLLDDSAEIEVWSPSGVGVIDEQNYPPTQSHATSCFINMCSLSEVLHRILRQLYDPLNEIPEDSKKSYILNETANMQIWWDRLPPFLKISTSDLPHYCPPSHVATLNAMFHMVKIQLNRPILYARGTSEILRDNLEHHVAECTSAADAIINVFDLYTRSFGLGHVMTAMIYCVYTAASIFLLQVQATRTDTQGPISKLKYCLDAMESVKATAPIIGTAIGLIQREIQRLNVYLDDPTRSSTDLPELPHIAPEEPNAYEWAAVNEGAILPQQWADVSLPGDMETWFDDSFFLAADVHSALYSPYEASELT